MKIHQLSPGEALKSLKSSHDGLSQNEALRRLKEFGPNQIDKVAPESLLISFLKEFIHFFALILWLAAGLAFFADYRQPGEGMDALGYAILGVIVINGLFAFWQQFRAERAVAALEKLLPHYVKVLRDNSIGLILATHLVPGDVILLQEGDNVSADCRIIEAFSLRVNNATVTGESMPKARDAEPSSEEDLLHGRNTLLAGTSVVSGEGRQSFSRLGCILNLEKLPT
jgi:Cation transport ATPase